MKNKKGFTLLELLVVVIIIGILAAIALPQYRKAVAKAELAQLLNVIKSFTTSMQNYYLTNNRLPTKADINSLDIYVNSENTICKIEGNNAELVFLHCSNKNFAVWTRVEPNISVITEIGMNSENENPALSYVCKDLFGNQLNVCSKVSGTSNTCARLGRKETGCFVCRGTKYL